MNLCNCSKPDNKRKCLLMIPNSSGKVTNPSEKRNGQRPHKCGDGLCSEIKVYHDFHHHP